MVPARVANRPVKPAVSIPLGLRLSDESEGLGYFIGPVPEETGGDL